MVGECLSVKLDDVERFLCLATDICTRPRLGWKSCTTGQTPQSTRPFPPFSTYKGFPTCYTPTPTLLSSFWLLLLRFLITLLFLSTCHGYNDANKEVFLVLICVRLKTPSIIFAPSHFSLKPSVQLIHSTRLCCPHRSTSGKNISFPV